MFMRAPWRLRALRRFSRARRGSAAFEFALVAVPFFLLTIGLAEIAMIGFAQTSLNFAVSNVSRDIRTGRAQMDGLTFADMRNRLCSDMTNFLALSCDDHLFLDVNRFDSFVDAEVNNPIQNNQFQAGGFAYTPGAPSDIVVVRAYYRWRIMTPMFETVFQNIEGGERVLAATMMFRNEPYMSQ
jgi:Flp pilus assembly protein TadG